MRWCASKCIRSSTDEHSSACNHPDTCGAISAPVPAAACGVAAAERAHAYDYWRTLFDVEHDHEAGIRPEELEAGEAREAAGGPRGAARPEGNAGSGGGGGGGRGTRGGHRVERRIGREADDDEDEDADAGGSGGALQTEAAEQLASGEGISGNGCSGVDGSGQPRTRGAPVAFGGSPVSEAAEGGAGGARGEDSRGCHTTSRGKPPADGERRLPGRRLTGRRLPVEAIPQAVFPCQRTRFLELWELWLT